ncbi:MAG TPA: DUF5686 family protein [Mucilaginibacter sp.]|nr:DUF5686 family protein [Mucilaginibacter sp.]
MEKTYCKFLKTLLLIFVAISATAQQSETIVEGTVKDARSGEGMPSVTIMFAGSVIGTSTNSHGKYHLSTTGSFKKIKISLIGYSSVYKEIIPGKTQTIDVSLTEDRKLLKEVIVKSGKNARYRNKGNPAVELIRQVIAHKNSNRISNYDYTEYKKYERIFFSLSNLSEKFKNKGAFRKYQFLFQEQDSTAIGGKILLPFYMEENISKNYYRKSPYAKKQIVEASKQVKYDEHFVDNEGLTLYFNRMYTDVDIYDNSIDMLGNQMLSPIADGAPAYYKFFITDTIKDSVPQLIELSFTPRSKTDLLFEGSIYITMDGNYAVQDATLTVNKNINLNFVRQMKLLLAFEQNTDGRYHLSQSDMKADFGLNKKKGGGVYGERVVILSDFVSNHPQPDEVYKGAQVAVDPNAEKKGDDYWQQTRPDSLGANQRDIYKNIDSLQTIPSFKRTMDLITLLLAGYKNYGPFEMGPVNTFYNFNPVEGLRLRLGGRTTTTLSKRYYLETYGAYGFKDKRFKYFLSSTYALNNKSIYSFPQEYIRASFQHDTKIPGEELQFVQEDNFLLSFKRGKNDTWLYNDIFRLDYVHEYLNHFSYKFEFKKWDQSPAGALLYQYANSNGELTNVRQLNTTELDMELRYAPQEKYYQGKLYRTPIPDKYPIFTLRYNQGIKNVFGGQYNYENLTGNVTKRFYLSQLGYADVSAEGGYIFGQLPFPLLDIHHANQTYALQLDSYNLMNFLEFVSDHYAAINIDQNFNGFIFNKVPLLKKLKWREVLSFKALWGGIRSENNPANNPSLFKFPTDGQGVPLTYSLNKGPYMEAGVGVANIFKILRLDMVERLTYLNHPYLSRTGIRARVIVQF